MAKISIKSRSYLVLLIALLFIVALMPFIKFKLNSLIFMIFFILLLAAALTALSTKGIAPKSRFITWLIRITAGLSFLSSISHEVLQSLTQKGGEMPAATEIVLHWPASAWWLQLFYFISLIGYSSMIAILIFFIIKDLFSGKRVTSDKIFGAITVYFLFGIMWTIFYYMAELVKAGSLLRAGGEYLRSYVEVQYFSFTTLSTLGYGDIVPGTKLTMVLSNLEAIVGSLYLAILVARLVGLYTVQSLPEEKEIGALELGETEVKVERPED